MPLGLVSRFRTLALCWQLCYPAIVVSFKSRQRTLTKLVKCTGLVAKQGPVLCPNLGCAKKCRGGMQKSCLHQKSVFLADETFANEKKLTANETWAANERI